MVAENDDPPLESRPPVLEDLVGLCSQLNSHGARYVVVGGMAVIQAGFVRATEDIDLLIAGDEDNVGLVREALMTLPDGAARDLGLARTSHRVSTTDGESRRPAVLVSNRAPRRSATTTASPDSRQTQRILALRRPRYETR